eukprot:CAMPEP_0183362206 /NCGR_PEP_ID=MMETSP0164_2-20130417/67596_1 /TAXON_ID=221442 /ORGANISM="Coccolithus pelagicus ssp braarudi, Strain PLY182g" /LENGTH=32 /DNA_ID= /DNA_START= /DNA_END= /DNA_ORIENTATION=
MTNKYDIHVRLCKWKYELEVVDDRLLDVAHLL